MIPYIWDYEKGKQSHQRTDHLINTQNRCKYCQQKGNKNFLVYKIIQVMIVMVIMAVNTCQIDQLVLLKMGMSGSVLQKVYLRVSISIPFDSQN